MPCYFVLHKPAGCITARRDHRGRSTVYDHVPPHYPCLPHVGRLDYNTEGLLLFTNDGRLAQALLNPDFGSGAGDGDGTGDGAGRPHVDKVYHVKLRGHLQPDEPALLRLAEPLWHPEDRVWTRPARVRWYARRSSADWVEVILDEGRSNQVRLLCFRSGYQVVKLRRVAFGPLTLGDLRIRWCRPLTEEEVAACYALALPGEPRPPYVPIHDTPELLVEARAARAAALARGEEWQGPSHYWR
ncbi:MAG: pseudouridine synthase [Myxococcota bacterium]|jgi:23S rRNA pseudouridine2605 synthase|nr:pseudouridine synthase [Myxococcota bacterium]